MILNCPSCAARFRVRHEMFADGPRKVKCARCAHRWMGEPETSEEGVEPEGLPEGAAETPQEAGTVNVDEFPSASEPLDPVAIDTVERDPRKTVSDNDDLPPLSAEARALGSESRRRRVPGWVWAGWGLLVVLIVATAFALIFARGPLIAIWPPVERLYDLVGLTEVPVATLRTLESSLSEKDGKMRVVVKLMIENHSDRVARIPVASVELINKSGKVFHTVPVRIPGQPLDAGEMRLDSLTLDDVPSSLDRVRVSAGRDIEEDK